MIRTELLDRLLPVPTIAQLMTSAQETLAEKGFPITNFQSGGVTYTLLSIVMQIRIELIGLARLMLNNGFVAHATEGWLELKAADFSKSRKQPSKAVGVITLTRTNAFPNVRITKGHIFKSEIDQNGDELRYIVTADTVFKVGQTSCMVPVEAEKSGRSYNVPANTITKTLMHIESVTDITNTADWLQREGADLEELESFRSRILNAWSELATAPTAAKYKSVCEAINGVLYIRVDDLHPRGQGTIDIIVTSTAGSASENLLAEVKAAADLIKTPYDNLLVKSSTTVSQNIAVTLQISSHVSDEGLEVEAKGIIKELLKVGKDRNLNELIINDLVYHLRLGLPTIRNAKVTLPTGDVMLDLDKVITLGTITVTIERL